MPSKLRGRKGRAGKLGSETAEDAGDSVVGRALALRSQRPKLALAGAGVAAAAIAVLAALLARRSRD